MSTRVGRQSNSYYRTGNVRSTRSEISGWNPVQELLGDAGLGQCTGHANTTGQQCRNRVNMYDSDLAQDLLSDLECLDPCTGISRRKLVDIAWLTLCKRWHRNQTQVAYVVSKWEKVIARHASASELGRGRLIELGDNESDDDVREEDDDDSDNDTSEEEDDGSDDDSSEDASDESDESDESDDSSSEEEGDGSDDDAGESDSQPNAPVTPQAAGSAASSGTTSPLINLSATRPNDGPMTHSPRPYTPRRQPLNDCAICMEPFHSTRTVLHIVHCRTQCGHNYHHECMKQWADHQQKTAEESRHNVRGPAAVKCPYCRSTWDWEDAEANVL